MEETQSLLNTGSQCLSKLPIAAYMLQQLLFYLESMV